MLEAGNDRDRTNTIEQTILGTQTSHRTTEQNNTDQSQLHNIDLLYKHNSQGFGSLTIDGSYTFSTDDHRYLVTTNGSDLNRIDGNNRYYVYSAQADYTRQTFGGIRLQAGAKYTHTHNTGLSDSSDPIDGTVY